VKVCFVDYEQQLHPVHFSASNRILCGASTGLSSYTTLTPYGQNFINLVALEAEPTGTLVSCDYPVKDF
jgi:hypothetical protein